MKTVWDIHSTSACHGDQPLVAIDVSLNSSTAVDALVDGAKHYGWRLVEPGLVGELMYDRAPAGAIVSWLPDDPRTKRLQGTGCAAVRFGRLEHPDDASMPVVLRDFVRAGHLAAEYLVALGYRDIGLVGHENERTMDLVLAGMRERVQTLGATCHTCRFGEKDGESLPERQHKQIDHFMAWLASMHKPFALTCGHIQASRILLACQRGGIAVPEDLAVLSIGDDQIRCQLAPLPLSAVDTEEAEMCRAAVRLLDAMMRGGSVPARTFIPPRQVVVRRSTEMVYVGHPLVARAVRYIWDHLQEDLSVDDVADAMEIPRYKLERLFRKHYTCGIASELRRKRLERTALLLTTTDLPLREIAERVGFNSPKFLHDSFRNTYGKTPREYRLAKG